MTIKADRQGAEPKMAKRTLRLQIMNAYGQDIGGFTLVVEWPEEELDIVLPAGHEFIAPIPDMPGHLNNPAPWSIKGRIS